MKSVRVVCAHDCPDMCSLIAHVDNGKVVRIQGDPDQPYTAGFACGKVNRDSDLVNSPERIATPLRRTGPKGSGQFKPITWDEALDEIAGQWKAIIKESGPLAHPGLRLLRPSGPDESRPGERAVPRARHLAAAGRHGLRHVLRDGLGNDGRPGGRRRSRDRSCIPTW